MGAVGPRRFHRASPLPLRIVTAVPLCDGHDSAIMTINHELVRSGMEVIYLSYHQAASTIARAAVQEDVDAVGISSYNGGHAAFFREVVAQLRARGAPDIRVFGGGGGTITPADERVMRRAGVERVFFAGTPLDTIVQHLRSGARARKPRSALSGDLAIARAISAAEPIAGSPRAAHRVTLSVTRRRGAEAKRRGPVEVPSTFVLGVAGPGGAGKSTLIDELTSRFLQGRPGRRIAILANDPSHPDSRGALLGDRVAAIYAQDDRVFFRSLATRGGLTGVSAAVAPALEILRRSREFDLIIVESVGIGQESDPFGTLAGTNRLVDAVLFVTSPHYGGRIQLEKIALLHGADLVALNKCDDPRASTAKAEIANTLSRRAAGPLLHLTVAAQHRDRGVDLLYAALADLAGFEAAGGERACQLQLHP